MLAADLRRQRDSGENRVFLLGNRDRALQTDAIQDQVAPQAGQIVDQCPRREVNNPQSVGRGCPYGFSRTGQTECIVTEGVPVELDRENADLGVPLRLHALVRVQEMKIGKKPGGASGPADYVEGPAQRNVEPEIRVRGIDFDAQGWRSYDEQTDPTKMKPTHADAEAGSPDRPDLALSGDRRDARLELFGVRGR